MKLIIHYFLLTAFCLLPASLIAQMYEMQDVENYIARYKEVAIEEMQRSGVPASITLAQGIIESGAGKSLLATKANNHFGIKCHDWQGEGYRYDDDRKNECFRKYDSALLSFKDHSDFLKNRQRYAVLFTYDPLDYKLWAKGLKACGYATNPRYANILIQCIEDYDLHQWDLNEEDRAQWFAKINNTKPNSIADSSSFLEKTVLLQSSTEEQKAGDRILVFNDIKCVTLQKGESLEELATAFEIGVNRLMRYNDITDPLQLKEGERVYLQPKRHNGSEKYHTVQEGETMFYIAHLRGIQLQKLYDKNKMALGTQPASGEMIHLRETRESPPLLAGQAPAPLQPESHLANPAYAFYIVAQGDTLYSISKKYNLTIEELKLLNELPSSVITPGTKLRVSR